MDTLPLPLEVAQIIFAFCIDDLPLHCTRAPLLLTKICREWRRVVLATPSLWTKLHIPVTDNVHIISALHSWLDYSRPLPVDCFVNFGNSSISLEAQDSYVRVLCTHAQRWRTVSIDLRHEQSIATLARLLKPGPFPNLRELRLHPGLNQFSTNFAELDQHPSWSLFTVFNSCEALHTLSWVCKGDVESLSSFSSDSIRCLFINLDLEHARHPFGSSALEKCFSHCPNLVSLSIHLPYVSTTLIDSDNSNPRSPLPQVRTLSLAVSNFEMLASLLVRMRFPCLEDLHLCVGTGTETPHLAQHFHNLLRDSASSLKKVKLDSDEVIRHPYLIPALSGLPNLTSLIFHDIYNPTLLTDLFKALTLKFSPSGRLLSSQNIVLEHIFLEVQYITVTDAFQIKPETAQPMMEDFFTVFVNLVLSRGKLPENTLSFEAHDVHRLVTFEVGQFFVDLYKHSYSSIWPERWPIIAQGWKDMEGIVQLLQSEDDFE